MIGLPCHPQKMLRFARAHSIPHGSPWHINGQWRFFAANFWKSLLDRLFHRSPRGLCSVAAPWRPASSGAPFTALFENCAVPSSSLRDRVAPAEQQPRRNRISEAPTLEGTRWKKNMAPKNNKALKRLRRLRLLRFPSTPSVRPHLPQKVNLVTEGVIHHPQSPPAPQSTPRLRLKNIEKNPSISQCQGRLQ